MWAQGTDSEIWVNQRGGVFTLLAQQLNEGDDILLRTAARVVLDAGEVKVHFLSGMFCPCPVDDTEVSSSFISEGTVNAGNFTFRPTESDVCSPGANKTCSSDGAQRHRQRREPDD